MRRLAGLVLLSAFALAACATGRLQRQLDPASRDFVSKVRYIITKDERATFLRLPAGDRKAFIDDFWRKRDPDPDTEENEYKDEYFQRIETASLLFSEGGGAEPGWLQDRGRIYILIGPPDERETYPRGVTFYGLPTEIWYYGGFPIIFVDEYWNGNYKLDPISANQLAEIMSVQMRLKPSVAAQKGALDCVLTAESLGAGKALARIAVPYRKIWFRSEGPNLRTTLTAIIEVQDAENRAVAKLERAFPLDLTEDALSDVIRKDFAAEVPLELGPGTYWIVLTLKNAADESAAFKKVRLVVRPAFATAS